MYFRKLLTLTISLCLLIAALFAPVQRTSAKELVGATSPAWSPDGRQIAYSIYQNQQSALYVIDIDGSKPVKIADNASEADWSPDGKWIAYSGYANDRNTIYITDVKTWTPITLTIGYTPKWSSDGKQLAYIAGQKLFIAPGDGSTPRNMITGPTMLVWGYAWSPQGKQLAFSAQGKTDSMTVFYVINADGTGLVKVGDSANDSGVSWSPDGSQVIFVGDCGEPSTDNICAANPNGSNLRALSHYHKALQPTWSPDGKQILFTNSGLLIMDADGGHRRILTGQDATTSDSDASWSPDGKQILFVRMNYPTSHDDTSSVVHFQVAIMNSDGSGLRLLPDSAQ